MKKLVCILLTLAIVFSLSVTAFAASSEKDFSDFPTDWSHDAMKDAVDNGLLQGSNGMISPAGDLTRAQMAAILVRAMGGTAKGDLSAFADVQTGAWYYNELSVAVGMKLIRGSGSLMRPNDPISREEAAVVLSRALCLKNGSADLSAFADTAKVSSWAKGAVSALAAAGYMKGDGKNLNPTASISREEFAQLMYNMISTYYPDSGTYTENLTGNVVLKADGTMLDGITVKGDVIVGDGVGNGTVTIKNCTVSGRIVARGGGENSIIIINTTASQLVAGKPDSALHIKTEQAAQKTDMVVYDGKGKVILDGDYKDISIEAQVPVIISNGTAKSAVISENGASLTVDSTASVQSAEITANNNTVIVKGTVNTVDVSEESINAKVEVDSTGAANTVIVDGTGATVEGSGDVDTVTVGKKAKETRVSTPQTDITNNSTDVVTTNNGDLSSGGTGTTDNTGALTGGSTGGGAAPTTYYKLTVSIAKSGDTQPAITNATTSATLSGSTPFYAQASSLVTESIRTQLKNRYSDASARAIMDEGLTAFGATASWTAFTGKYFPGGTAASTFSFASGDSALFSNRLVTFTQLSGTHTITYGDYTVTVAIAPLPSV